MLSSWLWQPPVEMRFHLLFLAKPFCQISLFVIFLYFFGMPNIERYQKQEVMVVSSTKLSGGFPAPTISVSAMNNFTGRGWKSNIIPPAVELIDFYCGNASDIQKCILDGTYNRSDVVKYVQIGYNRNESLMDPRFWREVFQDPYYGRRFTEVEFVHPVSASSSVKFVASGVNFSIFTHFLCFFLTKIVEIR